MNGCDACDEGTVRGVFRETPRGRQRLEARPERHTVAWPEYGLGFRRRAQPSLSRVPHGACLPWTACQLASLAVVAVACALTAHRLSHISLPSPRSKLPTKEQPTAQLSSAQKQTTRRPCQLGLGLSTTYATGPYPCSSPASTVPVLPTRPDPLATPPACRFRTNSPRSLFPLRLSHISPPNCQLCLSGILMVGRRCRVARAACTSSVD